MQKRPPKPRPDAKRLCDLAHMADEPQSTDVLGSYTGTAQDGEQPVQDADDLGAQKARCAQKTRRALKGFTGN